MQIHTLNAEYNKINLISIVMSLNYLNNKNKYSLSKPLHNYEEMFDETLGKYTGSDYIIDLKENAKPYHAKPFIYTKQSQTKSHERS